MRGPRRNCAGPRALTVGDVARVRRRADDRGAAAVEFAMLLPLLLLVLFGIVEYGSIFNAQLSLQHAAREGVREMVITGETDAARDAAVAAAVGLDPDAMEVLVTPEAACSGTEPVTVEVRYRQPSLTGLPVFASRFSGSVEFGTVADLSATAVRQCGG